MAAEAVTGALTADESEDDFLYEEVEVLSDDDAGEEEGDDLDAALRRLKHLTQKVDDNRFPSKNQQEATCEVTKRPEVVDDFIRNFCVKLGLQHTLDTFEAEWYELKATGKLKGPTGKVPDIYLHNAVLEEEVHELRSELAEAKVIAERASSTWDRFRRERDFHRMHHKRVAQEKNKLVSDMRRLRAHYSQYEPIIQELRRKYETVMKEKMLVRLEKDKLNGKLSRIETELGAMEEKTDGKGPRTGQDSSTAALRLDTSCRKPPGASLPHGPRKNPFQDIEFDPVPVGTFALQKTFKGHLLSVSNLALHPTKPVVASASDDRTWRMWHLPEGQLIMSGEGHKDWVGCIDFHPHGAALASSSGDATVKVWDFEKQKCVQTFREHQAVWCVKFHDLGDFLASGSMDHTTRLWDLAVGRCKMVLRGHVDSVNAVCWQPYTSNLCTASSDKTLSIWDARSGLCSSTFYGHTNSCNDVTFDLAGSLVATTDADGIAKLWDVRMVAELLTLDAGDYPANSCCLDRSGKVLAVASDDGIIRNFHTASGEVLAQLTGHEGTAHVALFDLEGQYLVSGGSDNTFRLWS